jgi:hypothetical protein
MIGLNIQDEIWLWLTSIAIVVVALVAFVSWWVGK